MSCIVRQMPGKVQIMNYALPIKLMIQDLRNLARDKRVLFGRDKAVIHSLFEVLKFTLDKVEVYCYYKTCEILGVRYQNKKDKKHIGRQAVCDVCIKWIESSNEFSIDPYLKALELIYENSELIILEKKYHQIKSLLGQLKFNLQNGAGKEIASFNGVNISTD